jgi:hypothetical protein
MWRNAKFELQQTSWGEFVIPHPLAVFPDEEEGPPTANESSAHPVFRSNVSASLRARPDVMQIVQERTEARTCSDFAVADELRDKLRGMGVIVKDTNEGSSYQDVSEKGE